VTHVTLKRGLYIAPPWVLFSVSERNGGTGNREAGKGRQARQAVTDSDTVGNAPEEKPERAEYKGTHRQHFEN